MSCDGSTFLGMSPSGHMSGKGVRGGVERERQDFEPHVCRAVSTDSITFTF